MDIIDDIKVPSFERKRCNLRRNASVIAGTVAVLCAIERYNGGVSRALKSVRRQAWCRGRDGCCCRGHRVFARGDADVAATTSAAGASLRHWPRGLRSMEASRCSRLKVRLMTGGHVAVWGASSKLACIVPPPASHPTSVRLYGVLAGDRSAARIWVFTRRPGRVLWTACTGCASASPPLRGRHLPHPLGPRP